MQVRTYVGEDLNITVMIYVSKISDEMANHIISLTNTEYSLKQTEQATIFSITLDNIFDVEPSIQEFVFGLKTYKHKKNYIYKQLNRIIETYSNQKEAV